MVVAVAVIPIAAVVLCARGETPLFPEPSAALDQRGCHSASYIEAQMDTLAHQAETGDAVAAYKLSFLYSHGNIHLRNGDKAQAFLVKAAEGGFPPAEAQRAEYYFVTYGKPDPNVRGAGFVTCGGHLEDYAKWLQRAAEHGYYVSQRELSQHYKEGSCGFPVDAVEAYKWATIGGDHSEPPSVAKELKMTEEQVTEAHKRVAAWKGAPHEDFDRVLFGLEWDGGSFCCTYETCDAARMFE